MVIYRAEYLLHSSYKDKKLRDHFGFVEEEDGIYKKTSKGYIRTDGGVNRAYENKVSAYEVIYCVAAVRYFERELSFEELDELKKVMQEECIAALKDKRDKTVEKLDVQIAYIQEKIAEQEE